MASGLERERHCDAICITRLSVVVVDVARPLLVEIESARVKGNYISGDAAANCQSLSRKISARRKASIRSSLLYSDEYCMCVCNSVAYT